MNIYQKVQPWLHKHNSLAYCHFEKFTPEKRPGHRHIEYIFYLIPAIQIRQDILPGAFSGPSFPDENDGIRTVPIFPYTRGIEIGIYFLFWGFRFYYDKIIHE